MVPVISIGSDSLPGPLARRSGFRAEVTTALGLPAKKVAHWNPAKSLDTARLDPDFERGATNLLNAMKAAICLFDIELGQMTADIRAVYARNQHVLGIFPVAAYNGGPKNVKKLAAVVKKAGVKLDELRPAGELEEGSKVKCPCLWKERNGQVQPVALPRYNNENRWYIEKYQRILGVFE